MEANDINNINDIDNVHNNRRWLLLRSNHRYTVLFFKRQSFLKGGDFPTILTLKKRFAILDQPEYENSR